MGLEDLATVLDNLGIAGLAAFAIWMLRASYIERLRDLDDYRQRIDEMLADARMVNEILLTRIQDNTEALARACAPWRPARQDDERP